MTQEEKDIKLDDALSSLDYEIGNLKTQIRDLADALEEVIKITELEVEPEIEEEKDKEK
jgi:hypothetical protein